jgi:hypothetical protein
MDVVNAFKVLNNEDKDAKNFVKAYGNPYNLKIEAAAAKISLDLKNAIVEKIEIRWPSGKTQLLENIKANQILTVKEP